jgi:hypothetical protein
MDHTAEIYALQSRIDWVREAIDDTRDLLLKTCEQVTALHARIDELNKTAEDKAGSFNDEFTSIHNRLNTLGEKLYLTYYKVFPGMVAADDALARAVKQAGNAPESLP